MSNEDRNLLSLEILSIAPTIDQTKFEGLWADLRKAIEVVVRKDGIRKDALLPHELETDVFKRAVDYIYDDVSEFYYWIFDTDDLFDRADYLVTQAVKGGRFAGSGYNALRKAVEPVVVDNLVAMRDADEILPEQDVEGLSEKLTDELTAYIINWQDWFYPRKVNDDIDAYYEFMAEHADIYHNGGYGDLTNNIDNSVYDGVTDVPYLSQ